MRIIKDIDQGSEEWLQLRQGVVTASNFSKIITSTEKESATLEKFAHELASQKMLMKSEEHYKNATMQRGNDLEPFARQAYQESLASFELVEEVGFIISDCGDYGCSPDGLVGEDGLLEIKCPQATTHLQYLLDNKLPTQYIQQVQGQLWVSNRKWCDFVSYHPDFITKQLLVIRVGRDEEFITKLDKLVSKTILLRDSILSKIK